MKKTMTEKEFAETLDAMCVAVVQYEEKRRRYEEGNEETHPWLTLCDVFEYRTLLIAHDRAHRGTR